MDEKFDLAKFSALSIFRKSVIFKCFRTILSEMARPFIHPK